jgi:hypothetical protein
VAYVLKYILIFVLVFLGGGLAVWQAYRMGGAYPLLDKDNAELMVSKTAAAPTRSLDVLFVGNSLTYVNDMPAMLVNIASSDPGNTVQLRVKAETAPDATLQFLLNNTDALPYAKSHHFDDVVLQEHDSWYYPVKEIDPRGVWNWTNEVHNIGAAPILFETWGDPDGSDSYTDQRYATFGHTPGQEAEAVAEATDELGHKLSAPVVKVGAAFERARTTKGAPDPWGPDRHHPSLAGTYLGALVFYRYFTGRDGAQATYRPFGMSAADASALVALSGE